jgi:hypothetical protein
VLLGNGDGTFQAPREYSVGSQPLAVAAADLTGNGHLDLAVANYGSGTVSVLLGNGDGTFQNARDYSAGGRPVSVATGDVNNDGIVDLAVANLGSGTASILLGNGDGSFKAPRSVNVGPQPRSVALGDFNGDVNTDLAVVFSGGVRVLAGNGDGSFQTTPVSFLAGSGPASVAVDDFNADGLPDLAVVNAGSNDVSILLNDGIWSGPHVAPGRSQSSGLVARLPARSATSELLTAFHIGSDRSSHSTRLPPETHPDLLLGESFLYGSDAEINASPVCSISDSGQPQVPLTGTPRWLADRFYTELKNEWWWGPSVDARGF